MALQIWARPLRGRSVPHRRGDGPWWQRYQLRLEECSPQAWGWPGTGARLVQPPGVFPTGVGMARLLISLRPQRKCVPHRRGDGPQQPRARPQPGQCSPQAWGWPVRGSVALPPFCVFPTGVGMARVTRTSSRLGRSVPHRRGDGPCAPPWPVWTPACSPQAWGWPALCSDGRRALHVFPTGVGMARRAARPGRRGTSVPHRRGDGPRAAPPCWGSCLCSPQAWGWPVDTGMSGL